MKSKNFLEDRDRAITGELIEYNDNFEKLKKIVEKYRGVNIHDEGPDPTSWWDLGRDCPMCKSTLKVREIDKEYVALVCVENSHFFYASTVGNELKSSDAIHRDIPLSDMLYYKNARRK